MLEGARSLLRRPVHRADPTVAERLRRPAKHGGGRPQVGLATLVMIACFAVLVSLTMARSRMAEQVRSPLSAKLADSERVAYYVFERDAGPRFRIGPGDHSIKLITHLLLPADTPYDPEQEYAYGVVLILRALDGRELSRHEINLRSRQSKSESDESGWRHENAFMLDDDRQLTDDRLTRVRLPEADHERLLELRLIPRVPASEVSGLARIYVRQPRPVDERTLRELSVSPEAGRALVDRLTERDWTQLSEDERRVKLSQVWERRSAEGHARRDYEPLTIHETGFRLPRSFKASTRRIEVERWRSVAINVVGPAELELRVHGPEHGAGGLSIYRWGLDGSSLAYPRHDAHTRPLTIPAGIHTLVFESDQLVALELEVLDAEAERVWFVEAERAVREDEDGNEVLEPDRRRIQVARVGAQWRRPPRWKIAGPADSAARIFRFDVRVAAPIASTWWRKQGPTPTLELCFFDAQGDPLSCHDWAGQPAIGSRFEGLREDGEPDDERGGLRLDPLVASVPWYVVSEPQTLRVIAPPEAVTLELRDPQGGGGQRLIVRGYGYWPEVETLLGEPFRSHQPRASGPFDELGWRYPPLDGRAWFPLRPSNYAELQAELAIADLYAQVRLEPRALGDGPSSRLPGWRWLTGDPDRDDRLANEYAGADGWDPGPWVTLEPRGTHRRRSILERLDDEASRRLAGRWDASLFTQVTPGHTLLTNLSAIGPGAPELHWKVSPRALGRTLTAHIDGRPYTHVIATNRGRWRLPIDDGRRRIKLDLNVPSTQQQLWIDRPILGTSSPISRRRTVHQLTHELSFPLTKPGPEALTVNLVVYLPRQRERAKLLIGVDRGEPERRTGIVGPFVSASERRYTIDGVGAYDDHGRLVDRRAPIQFVDLDAHAGPPLDVVTLSLTLGEDIVAGRHVIRVNVLDGGRVHVRAFHRGVGKRETAAASWTETTTKAAAKEPRE